MVGNRIGVDTDAIAIVGLAVAVLVTRLRAPQADLESKHAVNANQTWTNSLQCRGEAPADPRTLRFPISARSNTALWQQESKLAKGQERAKCTLRAQGDGRKCTLTRESTFTL